MKSKFEIFRGSFDSIIVMVIFSSAVITALTLVGLVFYGVTYAMLWTWATGLFLYLIFTGLSIYWVVRAARDLSGRRSAFNSILLSASLVTLLSFVAGLYNWSVFQLSPSAYSFDKVLQDRDSVLAIESARVELNNQKGLVECLLTLKKYANWNKFNFSADPETFKLSDEITMTRASYQVYAGDIDLTAYKIYFDLRGERIRLPDRSKGAIDAVSSAGASLAGADNDARFQKELDDMLEAVENRGRELLDETRRRMSGEIELPVWSFWFYSVDAMRGTSYSPISPSSRTARYSAYVLVCLVWLAGAPGALGLIASAARHYRQAVVKSDAVHDEA